VFLTRVLGKLRNYKKKSVKSFGGHPVQRKYNRKAGAELCQAQVKLG
jgi:hypothetical protein